MMEPRHYRGAVTRRTCLNVCERLCEEPFITLRACSNFTVASLSVHGMPHVALTNGHTLSLWRISSVNLR